MTKLRAPLTFENALDRIAARIGWANMAEAVGRAERTVRNWSDPDASEQCPIDCAHKLDLAYETAGGAGAPMFETYALLHDQLRTAQFADQAELGMRTIVVTKEASEAIAALIRASLPGAGEKERTDAKREVEEALHELNGTLPLLHEHRAASGEEQPP